MSEPAVTLETAVRDARQALESSITGELPLPYRRRIWLSFGPVGRGSIGHQRRAALDIKTAEHVLPLWYATQPDDHTPERVLAVARQITNGEPHDVRATDEQSLDFRAASDELGYESDDFVARDVGWAVSKAQATAEYDSEGLQDYPPEQTDQDVYPGDWDVSYYASLAVTGDKNPGEEETLERTERRRRFWRWYLDEAVPAAFRSAAE